MIVITCSARTVRVMSMDFPIWKTFSVLFFFCCCGTTAVMRKYKKCVFCNDFLELCWIENDIHSVEMCRYSIRSTEEAHLVPSPSSAKWCGRECILSTHKLDANKVIEINATKRKSVGAHSLTHSCRQNRFKIWRKKHTVSLDIFLLHFDVALIGCVVVGDDH